MVFESVMCGMMMSAGPSFFSTGAAASRDWARRSAGAASEGSAIAARRASRRSHERNLISESDQRFNERREEKDRGDAHESGREREFQDGGHQHGVDHQRQKAQQKACAHLGDDVVLAAHASRDGEGKALHGERYGGARPDGLAVARP